MTVKTPEEMALEEHKPGPFVKKLYGTMLCYCRECEDVWPCLVATLAACEQKLLSVIESQGKALEACIYRRRKDHPGFDPTMADANMMDEDPWAYIKRADASARAALKLAEELKA